MVTYDARPSAFTNLALTSEWEALFSAAGFGDGIAPFVGSAMAPSLDVGGRNAVIADGNAIIKGQLWRCDAPVSTPIPAASAQNRIDRLNRSATTSPTVVQPVVITGTPSGTPTEPPLVQTTTGLFDIPVSSWSSTSAGAITSLVDERQFSGRARLGEQFDFTTTRVQSTTSFTTMTRLWNIQQGDIVPNAAWRLRCWGNAVLGATQQGFNVRANVTGAGGLGQINWGYTNWPASSNFQWYAECTFAIITTGPSGTYSAITRMDQSMATGNLIGGSLTQMAAAGVRLGGIGASFNIAAPLQMWAECSWGGTAGSPYSDCLGSSFERIAI
jgi:hypothetical protein